ncbi:hypothetical protein PGT21_009372, partial [Puccinia graminis f. sp. tritici]
ENNREELDDKDDRHTANSNDEDYPDDQFVLERFKLNPICHESGIIVVLLGM